MGLRGGCKEEPPRICFPAQLSSEGPPWDEGLIPHGPGNPPGRRLGNRVSLHCRGILEPGTCRGCLSEGPSQLSSSSKQGESFIVNGSRSSPARAPVLLSRPPPPGKSDAHAALRTGLAHSRAAGFDGGQQAPHSRPIADRQNWLGSRRRANHHRCHFSSQQTPGMGALPQPLPEALGTEAPVSCPRGVWGHVCKQTLGFH